MSLISEILKRGLTVEEIKGKIRKERLAITEEIINQELEKEKQKILKYICNNPREADKVERFFNIIYNQSIIDGKMEILKKEYRSNGGKLKEGYISNLYHFGNLEENKYLMTYLFNRLKNKNKFTLEGYNLEYFKQEEKGVMQTITNAINTKQPERSEDFKNWLKALEDENLKRRENEKRRQELKRKREYTRRKKEEPTEEAEKSEIDNMISEMLENLEKSKMKNNKIKSDELIH